MIGLDIIEIKRFGAIEKNDYTHWSKFFTKDEWKYSFGKPNPTATLAGIYAAKEAVMKAVGEELMERTDRIEISHSADGKPVVSIDKKDQSGIQVSISHTKDIAAAAAIVYER